MGMCTEHVQGRDCSVSQSHFIREPIPEDVLWACSAESTLWCVGYKYKPFKPHPWADNLAWYQSHASTIIFVCPHLTPKVGIVFHDFEEQKPVRWRDLPSCQLHKFWFKALPLPNLNGKVNTLVCSMQRKLNQVPGHNRLWVTCSLEPTSLVGETGFAFSRAHSTVPQPWFLISQMWNQMSEETKLRIWARKIQRAQPKSPTIYNEPGQPPIVGGTSLPGYLNPRICPTLIRDLRAY